MDLTAVADELYGLPPQEFTAARNERAAEARAAGDRELAAAVRQLRKPTAGASIANLLVRKQRRDIDRLIKLGEDLRSASNLDGTQIRRASNEKAGTVTKLLRQAQSEATRAGVLLSEQVERELEATLDAAFSDPKSAALLRSGHLTSTLHYSGLGFGGGGAARSAATANRSSDGRSGSPADPTAKARKALEQATRDAARADNEAASAKQAVVAAEADLKRLQAALVVADRKAKKARQTVSAAQRRVDASQGRRTR